MRAHQGEPEHRNEVVDHEITVDLLRQRCRVITEDGVPLIMTRKAPASGISRPVPILLLHGFAQNRFTWHLPGRSLSNFLISQGFETFNAELRGHGLSGEAGSPPASTINEYITYDLPALITEALRRSGARQLFLCGHSLGGVIAACSVGSSQGNIKGLVTIASPFRMAAGNRFFHTLATTLKITGGRLPFERLGIRRFRLDLIGAAARRLLWYFDNRHIAFPLAMWAPGSMEREMLRFRVSRGFDVAGLGVLREIVRQAADGHPGSSWDGIRCLRESRLPALFIAGDADRAAPPASVRPGYEASAAEDRQWQLFSALEHGAPFGHIDLLCGRHAPKHVWPCLADWLTRRDLQAGSSIEFLSSTGSP